MTLPVIASLWIGGRLSYLEQLCLKSFKDHGHRTILYSYGHVENVPDGIEVLDANTIFPSTSYITHKKSGSPAVHADAFRYRMIEMQNVIWVDADVLCMQPWDFKDQFVFGWEKTGKLVCNAVLGLPRFSRTLKQLNEFCNSEYPIPPWANPEERARLDAAKAAGEPIHVSELEWGVWGPAALTHFLFETGEMDKVMPQEAFFPVSFKDRRDLLDPGIDIDAQLGAGCYGVHLWNRRIRRRIITHENGIPNPGSFLGKAITRHGIDPTKAMIPDVPPPHVVAEAEAKAAEKAAEKATGTAGQPVPEPQAPQDTSSRPDTRIVNPNVSPDMPQAMADMPVMTLQQSPEYQRMIDDLESRTGAMTGYMAPPKAPISNEKILVVTGMKNEAPFILEWVAYNRSIGVTDFLVYTNDCSDNTNAILDRLQTLGYLTRLDNPWTKESPRKPQHVALADAMHQPNYAQADWVLTIDVDEFVNIHVGDGTFADLFRASNFPNVISFTWKFFGNGGINDYADRPVMEQFTRCAPEFIPKPRLGWGFKSMFHKSAPYTKIGVHRPLKIEEDDVDQVRWVNGSGRAMPDMLLTNNGWRSTKRSLGYRLATLNHYVLRSAQSFLVKRDRGRINHTDQDQGIDYWIRRNYGTEVDDRIHARLPAMQKELDVMLADAPLAAMHEEAVQWHRGRIESLLASPDYKTLYDGLTLAGHPDALFVSKEEDDGDDEGGEDNAEVKAPAEVPAKAPVKPAVKAPEKSMAKAVAAGARFDAKMPPAPASASDGPLYPRFDEIRGFVKRAGGFVWEGGDNALMFAPKSRRLVVTFDNLSVVKTDEQRWPWGFDVLSEKMGCSVLGVMAVQRNWFRNEFVHDAFETLRDSGFFEQFDEVLFYGASMGGFGALVYSACAPNANVLAVAPQSTLDRKILPDDDRWGWTRKLDWNGRFNDAAKMHAHKGNVFVIADPYFQPDFDQVSRIPADGMTWLRTPFMGHQLPNAFVRMGVMKQILFAAADGTLSKPMFYDLFRKRRDLDRYQHDILMEAEKRGKTRLAITVCEYTLQRREAKNIRRSLERLQDQLAQERRKAG